tara:strand:+ start:2429 stop:2629 length:201 start_codon:yes stop_codon:yes gene_type:complete
VGKSIAGIKDDQQRADFKTLLEKLGPHKTGNPCLYLKRLDDVHLPTLKKLIKTAYKSPGRRRFPNP